MLNAFRDVEDQLTSLRLLSGQAEAQGRAVTAARRSALRSRRQELPVRAAQYVATVGDQPLAVAAVGGSCFG